MGFKNSGMIETPSLLEYDGTPIMNSVTSTGYTPAKDTNNSCLNGELIYFESGKTYYIEVLFSWSGFKTDAASNFGMWAQGSQIYNGSEGWSTSNPMANVIGNVTSLVLSADSGSKWFKSAFTVQANATGFRLGMRANYSNGTGKMTYTQIKVMPYETVQGKVDSIPLEIKSDKIMSVQYSEV